MGQKARNPRRSAGFWFCQLLDGADALGLWALLSLADLELNTLSLVEGLESGAGNLGVMNENVRTATVLRDEPEALFAVKPLHTALYHLLCIASC
jgi:hypothetical protein